MSLNRATKRNKPKANLDQELREEIHRLSFRYPRFGYRKIYYKLKEADWKVGRERVRLIRKQEGLQVINKQKKKRLLGKSTTKMSRKLPQKRDMLKVEFSGTIEQPGGSNEKVTIHRNTHY